LVRETGIRNELGERDGELYTPDFKSIADAFGIYSQKISQKGPVAGTVKNRFLTIRPALIEFDVCREQPYSRGKAFGWWDVPDSRVSEGSQEANMQVEIKGETV
jgi:TPP-dependent trihydroxycyclohexane-1,2-dione (THcHDO) dehydratase